MRNVHMDRIAMIMVQTTSPAALRVLGKEKEGTQETIHITAWKRMTCNANVVVSGVS